MSTYYFDSSGLVKYYVQEVGTQWVRGLVHAQPGHDIFAALITGVEVVAAVTRRARMKLITPADATNAIALFRNQFRVRYQALRFTDTLVDEAMDLAELHGLRGFDALQLASALMLEQQMSARGIGPLTFISADVTLNQAAQTEGLLTDDPNLHP